MYHFWYNNKISKIKNADFVFWYVGRFQLHRLYHSAEKVRIEDRQGSKLDWYLPLVVTPEWLVAKGSLPLKKTEWLKRVYKDILKNKSQLFQDITSLKVYHGNKNIGKLVSQPVDEYLTGQF